MVKIFHYRGKIMEELKKMTLQEFAKLVPARQRRRLMRGFSPQEKKSVARILKAAKVGGTIRTHNRDIIITPQMVGAIVAVHNGKEFQNTTIMDEMIGHYLGEFVLTRRRVQHGAPGIGATKSSLFIPLK